MRSGQTEKTRPTPSAFCASRANLAHRHIRNSRVVQPVTRAAPLRSTSSARRKLSGVAQIHSMSARQSRLSNFDHSVRRSAAKLLTKDEHGGSRRISPGCRGLLVKKVRSPSPSASCASRAELSRRGQWRRVGARQEIGASEADIIADPREPMIYPESP
jgi:hypothetical protein